MYSFVRFNVKHLPLVFVKHLFDTYPVTEITQEKSPVSHYPASGILLQLWLQKPDSKKVPWARITAGCHHTGGDNGTEQADNKVNKGSLHLHVSRQYQ